MRNSLFGEDRVSPHDEGQALLCTVYDPMELQMILGILDGAEIPFLLKDRGAGGVSKIILGYSSLSGTDIFVPDTALEAAEALITPVCEDTAEDAKEMETDIDEADLEEVNALCDDGDETV